MIDDLRDLPPFVAEAVRRLPRSGEPFPATDRARWMQLVHIACQWDYGFLDLRSALDDPPAKPPPAADLQAFQPHHQGKVVMNVHADDPGQVADTAAGALLPEPPPEFPRPDYIVGDAAPVFPCQYCGREFGSVQQRAGHKRVCKARPGMAPEPAHRDLSGDPVPTSVVPPDEVPRRGGAARRAPDAGTPPGGEVPFTESLRWQPSADAPVPSLGHRLMDVERARTAGIDAAIPRFGQ